MSFARSIRFPLIGLVLSSLACLPGACAASGDDTGSAGGKAGNAGSAGAAGGAGSAGAAGTLIDTDGGVTDVGVNETNACAGESYEGKMSPLDVYVLLDATSSMKGGGGNEVVWPGVTHALVGIITDTASAGISMGLTFFPVRPGPDTVFPKECNQTSDCGLYGPCESFVVGKVCAGWVSQDCSCDWKDYGKPVVEIGSLPGNAAALQGAITGKDPDGSATPTQLALEGTLAYAHNWAAANPTHLTAVLLATDGEPNNCTTNSVAGAAAAAKAAFEGTPSVATYVMGFGNVGVLNEIASAGGTSAAWLADSSDVADKMVAMFNTIRSSGSCLYEIPVPENGKPDYDRVNVSYTPKGATEPVVVGYVMEESQCHPHDGGWYYDDPTKQDPKRIILCPATCQAANQTHTGVTILLGCATKVY